MQEAQAVGCAEGPGCPRASGQPVLPGQRARAACHRSVTLSGRSAVGQRLSGSLAPLRAAAEPGAPANPARPASAAPRTPQALLEERPDPLSLQYCLSSLEQPVMCPVLGKDHMKTVN